MGGGGSQRTHNFAQKLLIFFTIQSRVIYERRKNIVLLENRQTFESVKTDQRPRSRDYHGPQSHDPTKIARPILIGRR